MKAIILIILFCIFAISCGSQKKEVIAKSTIRLEGKNTSIKELIEIDVIYSSLMFFEDGTWVQFSIKKNEEGRIFNFLKNVDTWIDNRQIRWGTYWGVYSIQNDTIIVHSYDKGTLLKGWSFDEIRFKIVNRETIQWIYYRSVLKSADEYYKTHSPWREGKPLHFTPADSLPSSDNWLKENKWIWRNESDWKAYMQHVEEIKKQNKRK